MRSIGTALIAIGILVFIEVQTTPGEQWAFAILGGLALGFGLNLFKDAE